MSRAGEKGSSLWKLEGKMTLEDTYHLSKTHKKRVRVYLRDLSNQGKKTFPFLNVLAGTRREMRVGT